jgi:hypothetical protein
MMLSGVENKPISTGSSGANELQRLQDENRRLKRTLVDRFQEKFE